MVVSTTDETPSARGVTGVEAELPHGRLSASPGEAKTSEKTFFLCVNWPFNASRSRTMQTRGATFTFICPVKDCNKRMEQPLKTGLKNTRDLWEIKLWPLGAAVAVVNIIWQWFFFFFLPLAVTDIQPFSLCCCQLIPLNLISRSISVLLR